VQDSCRLSVVEGPGAGRLELVILVDKLVWAQSDAVEARRRGIERDGEPLLPQPSGTNGTRRRCRSWTRIVPWERAHLVICSTPTAARGDPGPTRDLKVGHPKHYPARSTSSSPRW
jgi:hypothetical protein